MRVINQETWPRKNHFNLYNSMEFPHIGLCVQVDITDLWANRSRVESSPTIALVYTLTKAANRVPEMRQRIQGDQVIEYDVVHPIIAVLGEDNIFGVCSLTYGTNFTDFATQSEICLLKAKKDPSMADFHIDQEGNIIRDDILSMTVLPWLSFTSFTLTRTPRVDSVPLLAWGKVISESERYLMPFFVSFHHALVDGLHIAKYVQYIEEEVQELSARFK